MDRTIIASMRNTPSLSHLRNVNINQVTEDVVGGQ